MTSAFGIEHQFSKMVVRRTVKPKGKLRKIQVGAVNASHRVVATAGPTPTKMLLASTTPLRALASHA